MKQPRLSRRQFFQASAFGTGALALPALGLATVAAAPSREARASAEQPLAPAIPQPTFNPIASNTTIGPLTDISMGWDGTLWGIDAQGAPHIYDQINKVWAQHGDGIDAAANDESGKLYVFQGPNVVSLDGTSLTASAPTTIAALWPNLPDSFKLGVSGAMTNVITYGPGLILFNGGRYCLTDGTNLGKLIDLQGWPQTAPWTVNAADPALKDAVIDAAFIADSGELYGLYLLRAGQVIQIDLGAKQVIAGPMPFAQFASNISLPLPADWVSSGSVDAYADSAGNTHFVFKGTAVLPYQDGAQTATPQYIGKTFGNWPSTWHPVLQHAPNGRDGNLWSVLPSAQGSYTMQHNGDAWTQQSFQADHVGVGQDNAVMLASAQKLWTVKPNSNNTGYDVAPVSQANNLIQVSLGNANAVNARDTSGNVYSFDPTSGTLTQNTDVGTAAHIATTNDGSLWHAKPSNPNMNRQLVGSGQAPEAIPIKNGLTATVSKVAGTGFGAAHCLTQDSQGNTQAYRYDSPYVFKTAAQYNVGSAADTAIYVEQGAGLLFLLDGKVLSDNPFVFESQVVAIDAHTGVEVARKPQLPNAAMNYGQPVFDPLNNLVYVAIASSSSLTDTSTPGQILALDARTLAVKWSFTTKASVDAAPLLRGTRLFVNDRTGEIYMFDTAAALANPANVQPRWAVNVAAAAGAVLLISQPVYVPVTDPQYKSDLIYVATWQITDNGVTVTADGSWMSVWVADGTINDRPTSLYSITSGTVPISFTSLLTAPIDGTLNIGSDSTPNYSPAVYFNCGDRVIAIGGGPTAKTFSLPAGDYVTTGFTYDDGSNATGGLSSTGIPPGTGWLWFGTLTGQLYCLDTSLRPVNYTPASIAPANQSFMSTTPTLYKDTQGNVTVFFQAKNAEFNAIPSLYGFSPDNGNVAALPTGATTISALSRTVTHGVLYTAGVIENDATTATQFPQVFAIRVDQLVQAERDFIIESQLMQDPQDPGGSGGSTVTAPDGNVIPPSVARYQTHLTVVDDQKSPLPNEPVKIWADVDGTVITVNNTQYTIGPADSAYASVQTGVDGALVIVSDATDVNASALRVWAPFMDPFERIMVYPDHEWHGRASQSNANGSVADPAKPNLNTAYSYKPDPNASGSTTPKPLFSQDEKNQGTPTNVANAVGQMNTGLNPGGNSAASVAGALKTLHASNPAASYVAYTDLGGMHYGPTNARAKRTATVAAPFGFVLNKTADSQNPQNYTHTYTPLSHSDARSAIDALPYPLWDPNNPSGKPTSSAATDKPVTFVVRRTDDIFTDFWNWLVGAFKAAVDAIENVIVSVADDIMVGINFIIDGVKQAFKAIIKVIEDVVNAIGSFFLQLAKLIEDLIEALSVLFHFGEIIWTHNWAKGQINTQVANLKSAITTTIQPKVDGFFKNGVDAIKANLGSLQGQLTPNGQVSNLKGAGSTPHSAYTLGPKGGAPSSQSSQAVQCSHSTQKLKSGLPSASAPSAIGTLASPASSSDDPVADFITTFMARLTGNGDLAQTFSDLGNQINNLFTATSATQFFNTLVNTLVDLLIAVVEGVVVLTQALVDGMLAIADDFIDAIMGFLNNPIDIPFISWLYQLLFKEQLTILNALTLVMAIPATIIFRVVEGQYPSAMLGGVAQRTVNGAQSIQALPPIANDVYAFMYGLFSAAVGVANGVGDFLQDAAPPLLGWAAVGGSLLAVLFEFPLASNDTPSDGDWYVYGLSVANVLYGAFLVKFGDDLNKYAYTNARAIFASCALNLAYLIASVNAFIEDGKRDASADLGFASNVVSSIPGMLNFIKYIGATGKVVATVLDVVGGIAVLALSLASAILSGSPAPSVRRLHFPFVAFNPQPAGAHPLTQPLRLAPALAGATP